MPNRLGVEPPATPYYVPGVMITLLFKAALASALGIAILYTL